ncbi:hypothetical protein Tco_1305749, partial [Tanacetum coccineum]
MTTETDPSYLISVLGFLSFFRANPADIFTFVTGHAYRRVLIEEDTTREFLIELRSNAYCGTDDEDVVDHIAKVLEILDLIKTPNVDTYRLRLMVFPLSLAGDARQCWNEEPMDDIVSKDEEWEDSDYGNPLNTTTNLFFKPYLD